MNLVRMTGRVVLTAAVAVVTSLAAMWVVAKLHGDRISPEDLSGFGVMSLVFGLLLAALVYTPAAIYGRRRHWSRGTFMAVTLLALNLPVYALLVVGMLRHMFAASEAGVFAMGFIAAAMAFVYMSETDI